MNTMQSNLRSDFYIGTGLAPAMTGMHALSASAFGGNGAQSAC